MPLTMPHTFVDGPGNVASGEEVMDNLNAINAGVAAATVTSLPGSPVNGQDCYYLADATNGIVWHLKYRSASASAYKWEFVGGGVLHSDVATSQTTASTTYADLATAGPTVTVPLAGDYDVSIEASANTPGTLGAVATMSFAVGASAAADADSIAIGNPASTGGLTAYQFRTVRKTGLAAATALTSKYKMSTGTGFFLNRSIRAVPVRVG